MREVVKIKEGRGLLKQEKKTGKRGKEKRFRGYRFLF